jgi:peptidoglycan/xylan/chitin deacetylase (PgdA/CDA1 family)
VVTRDFVMRVAHAACRLAPSAVLHRVMNIDVIVLMYHVVSDEILPHVAHLYPYKTPAEFALDMDYLKVNYHILSFQECERGDGRRGGWQPAVLLTFDDGLSECFDIVRPILLQRRIPCTFFVTTSFIDNQILFYRHTVSLCIESMRQIGFIGREPQQMLEEINSRCGCHVRTEEEFTRWIKSLKHTDENTIESVCDIVNVNPRNFLRERQPYLTTRQLAQLAADGFTLGGHGKQHAELAELGDPALIETEIVESCEHVRRIAGTGRVPFAFPFTGRRVSRALLQDIVRRHAAVSFLFDTNGLAVDAPFVMNRIGADRPADAGAARSTLPDLLRSAVEREGAGRAAAWVRRLLL